MGSNYCNNDFVVVIDIIYIILIYKMWGEGGEEYRNYVFIV